MGESEWTFKINGVWDGKKSVDIELFEGKLKLTTPPGFDNDPGVMWPEELLPAILISCLFNTFRDIAMRMRVEYNHWEAEAETTLGIDPAGGFKFNSIKVHIKVGFKNADENKISKLMYLTKKYCLVSKAIKNNVEEVITYEVV